MLPSGRIGYLHIPDMGPRGYAEFHRGFLAEVARDGLIVDVRYNGGGHVSQLLLEKLARRRIGYDRSRWGGISPYPSESMAGPIVALTNELAGSDGDIFCHSFKVLKLGPLIGKRTWGGVVGVSPRNPLVDGTITTQPEYSFWFEDVGWTVENYGTEPDIEVDNTPQDYVAGRDPQLERAFAEALRLLADKPVVRPDLKTRPSRALPKLPHKPAVRSSPGRERRHSCRQAWPCSAYRRVAARTGNTLHALAYRSRRTGRRHPAKAFARSNMPGMTTFPGKSGRHSWSVG